MSAVVATIGLQLELPANSYHQSVRFIAATEAFISARGNRGPGTIDPRAIPWEAPERLAGGNGFVSVVGPRAAQRTVQMYTQLVSASPVVWIGNRQPSGWRCAPPRGLVRAVRGRTRLMKVFFDGASTTAPMSASRSRPDARAALGLSGAKRLPGIIVAINSTSCDRYLREWC